MAFRIPVRRAATAGVRGLSSQATAASNLSQPVQPGSNRDAALTHPDPAEDSPSATLVKEHSKYMLATYSRPSPVFVRGEGSHLWDMEHRKYLDFTSGIAVNGLGHCDPGVARIIADQVCS